MTDTEAFVREKYPTVLLHMPTVPRGQERLWWIRKSAGLSDHDLAKLCATPEEAWAMAAEQIRQGLDA